MITNEINKGQKYIVIINPKEKHPYEIYEVVYWENSLSTYQLTYIDSFKEHLDAIIYAGRMKELELKKG